MQRNHMLPMASRNAQSSTQQAPFVIQGNRIFCGKPECRRSVVVEDTRTRQQRTVMMPRELAFLHPDVDEHGNLIRVMQCSSCGASTAVVAEREHEHRCSGCGLVDRWSEPVKAPVWEMAARSPDMERPALTTMIGLVRATCRAALINRRASPTDSM